MKDAIIGQIESIRRINNSCWMELLRIALEAAPERTRKVLAQIDQNDRKVSSLMKVLAEKAEP